MELFADNEGFAFSVRSSRNALFYFFGGKLCIKGSMTLIRQNISLAASYMVFTQSEEDNDNLIIVGFDFTKNDDKLINTFSII